MDWMLNLFLRGKMFMQTLLIYTYRQNINIYIFFFFQLSLPDFSSFQTLWADSYIFKRNFKLIQFLYARGKVEMLLSFLIASTVVLLFSSGSVTLWLCLNFLICLKMIPERSQGTELVECYMTLHYEGTVLEVP